MAGEGGAGWAGRLCVSAGMLLGSTSAAECKLTNSPPSLPLRMLMSAQCRCHVDAFKKGSAGWQQRAAGADAARREFEDLFGGEGGEGEGAPPPGAAGNGSHAAAADADVEAAAATGGGKGDAQPKKPKKRKHQQQQVEEQQAEEEQQTEPVAKQRKGKKEKRLKKATA